MVCLCYRRVDDIWRGVCARAYRVRDGDHIGAVIGDDHRAEPGRDPRHIPAIPDWAGGHKEQHRRGGKAVELYYRRHGGGGDSDWALVVVGDAARYRAVIDRRDRYWCIHSGDTAEVKTWPSAIAGDGRNGIERRHSHRICRDAGATRCAILSAKRSQSAHGAGIDDGDILLHRDRRHDQRVCGRLCQPRAGGIIVAIVFAHAAGQLAGRQGIWQS